MDSFCCFFLDANWLADYGQISRSRVGSILQSQRCKFDVGENVCFKDESLDECARKTNFDENMVQIGS